MHFRTYKTRWRRALILALGVPAVLYFIWTSGQAVIAFQDEKRAHIFPTEVSQKGWESHGNAIAQDLSPQAPFASFSKQNSAWIVIEGSRSLPQSIDSVIPPPSQEGGSGSTEPIVPPPQEDATTEENVSTGGQEEVIPPSQDSVSETPAATSESEPVQEQEPAPTTPAAETPAPAAVPEAAPESTVTVPAPENAPAPEVQQEAPVSLMQRTLSASVTSISQAASFVFAHLIETAFATTSGSAEQEILLNPSSTPAIMPDAFSTTTLGEVAQAQEPVAPDIATCTVLAKDCHTIEFSGFRVEGSLTDKKLKAVELNFSFASLATENQVTDGKLLVRYYHKGAWRSAGEIYLNKELSNATNGGYFSSALTDLSAWEDLSDVRVVIEYVQGDEDASAELYLDAVWLDAIHRERVQNVISGDVIAIPDDTPENVEFSLDGANATSTFLVLESGEIISFPYTDGQSDTLSVRVDRDSYIARVGERGKGELSTVVYASVRNTGTEEDSFRLFAAFDDRKDRIKEISQFFRNVASTTQIPLFNDVTYQCESGWEKNASSSPEFGCATTGEVYTCSWTSENKKSCLVEDVHVGFDKKVSYESTWVSKNVTPAEGDAELVEKLPPGYSLTSATEETFRVLPGQTVYFKIVLRAERAGPQRFALLMNGGKYFGGIDTSNLKNEKNFASADGKSKRQIKARANDRISSRTEFDGDELPEFRFKFKTQRGVVMRTMRSLLGRSNTEFKFKEAHLRAPDGEREDIPVAVEYDENGEWKLEFKKHPHAFKPGKYSIELTVNEGSQTYTDTYDFYWGVLAVNTNKSVYISGERAWLQMAALDDTGSTICDAILELAVTDPNGASQMLPVTQSGKCGPNNVIDVPDYSADYQTGGPGEYHISLTEFTSAGTVIHHISDSFTVRADVPFEVERIGPTRIYPKAPYTMELRIKANRAFSGSVTEMTPLGFTFPDKDGGTLAQYGEALHLSWGVTLARGEEKRIRYTFDAPDVSPYLYILGPLTMRDGSLAFEEARSWKIASDALGSYVEKKSSWSPTTAGAWEAKDLSGSPFNVPANAVIEVAVVNSDTNDAWIAGVRHASSSVNRYLDIHEAEPQGTVEFVMHVQASATSSIQTYAEDTTGISFVLLGYWTDGYYVERFDQIDPNITDNTWGTYSLGGLGVASGTVAEMIVGNWNNGVQRIGGVRASSVLTRSIDIHESEGASAGVGGVNGFSAFVLATSSGNIQLFAEVEGANNADIDYWLTGYWSRNPTGLQYTERFSTLAEPGSASTWTDTTLNGFGVPATGIAEVIFANIGAANNSAILGVRADGSSIDRSFNIHEAEAGGWSVGRAHVKAGSDANATIDLYTDNTTDDSYRLLGYWAASNYPPNAPTLYDIPFDNEKTGSSTPSIRFSATDPDGASDIVYQIQWDDDSILDDSPIGDRTSSNESGCSPNCFQDLSTGDTSPFTEGDLIQFKIQTALVSGTTYYWRVRATDVTGSNIESDWSDVQSFTYVAGTDPSQWLQTQDAQFDTGTLSSVETSGGGSVELVATAPGGAMIAYGEGVVQTPRYRTWDGSAWSAEDPNGASLSVGGTIQWMKLRAGTTRNEYVLGTQDSSSDVNVQVFDGDALTWGDLQEVTQTISDITARGFDIAYETTSGDALVVYCDGDADPSYYVWNGGTWTLGTSPINLGSANNCEWIKLASDPVSDEIILVSRDTGAQYEAMVWDGSAWGNSTGAMGSMSEVLHEGIAVEYEDSGDQAVVTVSNGTNASFVWAAWNGAQWSTPATQTLGDDFEWGEIRRDDGSDAMALCYVDQDDDMAKFLWDGGAWESYEVTDEFDGGSNVGSGGTADGRPLSCEFETTAGRDGYVMIPYSDTTNGRYQAWTGGAYSGEQSVSTIQDSWSVGSIRTGEGKILAYFHDDVNSRYDFSYWDGSSWATQQTLENSPSDTTEPFSEPLAMAARIFQSSSGTIMSEPATFTWVSGQPTWGEALWNTTEPSGTNVLLQVYFATSTSACADASYARVPEGVGGLTGNAAGFEVTSSPLDLTGLSTTTYPKLCLKATLSSTGSNIPTLNDWSISWERQPYLALQSFRWYVNTASLTPTDPWPSGGTDLNENDTIPQQYSPYPGQVLRLRMSILDENVAQSSSNLSLRLQYAQGQTCSASLTWLDVGAIGSTTAAWRGYDNGGLSDGATLSSLLISTADTLETYEEQNDSSLNPNMIAANNEGEWDWVIEHNATENTSYCFRVINAQNEVLNEYAQYPSLVTNGRPAAPILDVLFDNEQVASTTPFFEFSAQDPDGNDMTYQIQIDDTYAFTSTVLDRDSQNNDTEFENIITPSDKDPFTSEQTIRFVPTTALSDGTTYYWRVRAKDRNASATWSSWSDIRSFTINTATAISTWHQTMLDQFATGDFDQAEATSTNDVVLTPPNTTGTTTSDGIDFDWHTSGNAWGSLSWNDTETGGTIIYHIEYWNGTIWQLVPDTDLPSNAAGFGTSPTTIAGLDTSVYNLIRPRANLTLSSATPRLLDWTVTWGNNISQATSTALFDNEKTGTSTPTFKFSTVDPQGDDLEYEISWSTSQSFTSSTTRNSTAHAGFFNLSTPLDTSPFNSGNRIQFTIQPADALVNGTTYWWRVRARDTAGGNIWSVWSSLKSFTYDSTTVVSTWFQTTDEQFDTDTLSDIETTGNAATISSVNREAFVAYAEGTQQAPRMRVWNGTEWGTEINGSSTPDSIRFVETAAAPTRDEYVVVTQGSLGTIYAQVFNGTSDIAGNFLMMGTSSNMTRRAFDVAYESSSGDAMVVTCDGSEAAYHTWNGSSWSATSTITLAVTSNCEWIQLASDPGSDEIIMIVRDATTGTIDYQALVWPGSAPWGNSTTLGSQANAANEGMAIEYEESGGDAVFVAANGLNNNFLSKSWNGSTWAATSTITIGNDFAGARIARDVGTDELALCYIDVDNDMGLVEWNGGAWGTNTEFETSANNYNGRPLTCQYETTAGRDGNIMIPYSDSTGSRYQYWTTSFSGEQDLTTVGDSWELRSARTGDGNILTVAYDDGSTEYDFTYWDGSSWSTEEVLESSSIPTVSPATIPIDIVARRFQTITSASITSSSIVFTDGLGPKWGSVSWTDSTPGGSDIIYQVEYYNGSAWALIPDGAGFGGGYLNSVGTTTSPIDIANVSYSTYGTLRLKGALSCNGASCPTLSDWTLLWSEGVHATGTAKAFDQTTNLTSGTVQIAVNGVKQIGRTAAITGGTWDVSNVAAFTGDVITAYIEGAGDSNEAVAVTVYDGSGNIGGMQLFERHLTLGSLDNPTVTNVNLSAYDNSVSGDEDIFFDVDAGNDLSVCSATGCYDSRLLVASGATYRPDTAGSGSVTGRHLQIDGTMVGDGNTFTLSGSWRNAGTWTAATSTVVFSATSTIETVDSFGALSGAFNNVTFGSGASTATWNLLNPIYASSTFSMNFGTTSMATATSTINLGGNLAIGVSGNFKKNQATTTFMGTGSSTWTDSSSGQDMGKVVIDGSSKTVILSSSARATNITIGSDDTFGAGSNTLTVYGDWTNNNVFTAGSGTVTFAATTTGRLIAPGQSTFNNMTFNGSGGNWSFQSPTATTTGNFTVTLGTVTMPTATTTVGGSFSNSATFQHNNGAVLFNASGAQTIDPGSSSFYDLAFSGSGSWSFSAQNATSSRNTIITQGALTLPQGTLAVGGSFLNNGGSFSGGGTLRMTAADTQSVRFNGSSPFDLAFAGAGPFSFVDTNATTTRNVTFLAGTTTLPSGTFAVGGSFVHTGVPGTAFTHNSGTVKFVATTTGFSITTASSTFYNLLFDATLGGWTITGNATSSRDTTITNASSLTLTSGRTLEVDGTFTNSVANAATSWAGSTLYLNASSTYTINTKTSSGDIYGTLMVGSTTKISMWNSSASTVVTGTNGYVYSQDHGGTNGSLYIYGAYSRSSGADYWSYATDFDGTSLSGGSERQVDVRIATSSTVTFSGGILDILGGATATTTIRNQGVGRFDFNISGGTLNAQYYSIASTTQSGFSLSGSPTVTSLSDGHFTLSASGTAITLASTVINANPALNIQRVRFATTTGVAGGTNVAETGTPTSYWWFRNHYGEIDGENYDNDPGTNGGNPGYVRWDDSFFTIDISGTVYSGHGTGPGCLGSTIRAVVNGGSSFSGTCSGSTYTVSGVQFLGDPIITVYIDGGSGKAVAVTRSATDNITGLDLYQNALIVRSESADALTIANLVTSSDNTDDTDIMFTASGSTLTVMPDNELYVWTGETFAPGGTVTLQSGGSGDARDGRLWLASSATFTAAGTESHSIGGGFTMESGATFTPANSTLTFTATTTGKSISTAAAVTLYDVVFNGSGGGWALSNTAGTATTTVNTLAMTAGTLSGTGDMIVSTGGVTGSGVISMTGGEFRKDGTGNFAGANPWTFYNLTFGSGAAASSTKTGSATTTVSSILKLAANYTVHAGSSAWVLSGSGVPFAINGSATFNVMSAPFTYNSTSATEIENTTYANLFLAPSGAGTPTYTLQSGILTTSNLSIGGANPVVVTVDSQDPTVDVNGDLTINTGSTFTASNIVNMNIAGSWTNSGTFTHSGRAVVFDAIATGKSIDPGTSPFYDLTFNSASGGWTITGNATSTHDTTISNASSFTLQSGRALSVWGTFTNSVSAATTWTGSTLYLRGGGSYSVNTKTDGAELYGTLLVGTSTHIRMWNSSSTVPTVDSTGSLYSQDHANVNGDLYIWGSYTRSSGADYWSYATDFDGTDLSGGSERQVDVRIATSAAITLSGGVLDILGSASASTTVQAYGGVGAYAFAVSGGTLNANYYSVRHTDANGINITGTPTVTSLSYGDFEHSIEGGTSITVDGTVITQNPLKIFQYNRFATSSISSGFNVKFTGTSGSFWKFNLHYGNADGEAFDNDADPGNVRWDDSNDTITVSGNVYSDEGSTVSSVCDGLTPVVRLKSDGQGSYVASCSSTTTGAYTISGVSFNPGATLTVYLDTNGGRRAANVTIDPSESITNMHLYENRVIVRHEDTAPITIADLTPWDSDEDSDIPFDATDAATDTLVAQADTKLIVWNAKSFAPGGNVTLQSGGSGAAYDGSLQLFANSTFTAAGTQSHSIGGSFVMDTGAALTPALSTFTFAATTTGKTITVASSTFYKVVFDGGGGNWAFSTPATSTDNFTITRGTVTLPTGTLYVGGSFVNDGATGGSFMHNNGTLVLSATSTGKSIQVSTSTLYNLTASGGGSWSFVDSSATTTNNFIISSGTLTAPSQILAVGGNFQNTATFSHNNGTVKLTSTATGKTIAPGSSSFYNLSASGVGGTWSFTDTVATTTRHLTLEAGTTTLPSGTLNVGGSFVSTNGAFSSNSGTVRLTATTTGFSITPATSTFYNLTFDSSAGGWTITGNATSTNNTTITAASSLTLQSGRSLEVGGTFTNSVGGGATTWTGSILYLNSGTTYSINTKTDTGDSYDGTLLIGGSTKVSMWSSSADTVTFTGSGSLYSQDNGGTDGSLYIYGTYTRSNGTDYWSAATDFDGAAIGSRAVSVRIATSSSVSFSGGTLNIIGTATATTSIAATYNTPYKFQISGGTLNANYYQFRYLNGTGLQLTGAPTISSLSYGDFELSVDGGSMISASSTVLDANASITITGVRFATTTGVNTGYNVTHSGTVLNPWYFTAHYGNRAGESYDTGDGQANCGVIRWDDSVCLLVEQVHYRWRNDDGGEGAPNSEWYNASWSKRKKIGITNPNATAYTNLPVKIDVVYDADMQSDFDDLRFTSSDGTTLLDHWIESTVASASSTVWVEVPSLPSSGSAVIYAYYGNGSAGSASVGTTTFTFFDDFEDDNITEYSGSDSQFFETSPSFNHNWSFGLDADDPDVDERTITGGIYQTNSSYTSTGKTIQFWQYVDAGQGDEPCTLFGVQAASQNYAVCLDQSPSDKVKIVENAVSDDDSGTTLASTTVTWVDGWYRVTVDWQTSNPAITVNVYTAAGTLFASVTAHDTSYTSGGVGFTFWGQHGGWDFYSVKQYTASAPTYVFGLEQASGGATWRAAEDTEYTTSIIGEILRLRFNIQNTANTVWGRLFGLQYAEKGGALNCQSVAPEDYSDVPVFGSCGVSPVCMATSTQYVDGDSTTPLLTYPATFPFSAGKMVEDPSFAVASTTVAANAATEVEYAFKMTSNATQEEYCFRSSDGESLDSDDDLDGYTNVAEINLQFPPVITNNGVTPHLNHYNPIILTEGTSTYIYASSTVTDVNGFADIIFGTSTIYLSSVPGGADCTQDDNNCYQMASTSCSLSSCSGNSCQLSCRATMRYHAIPTDASSTATWKMRISAQDATGLRDTEEPATDTVELMTLRALSVTSGAVNYGTIAVGADTGSYNATTTTRNTGNSDIDVQVGLGAGGTINVATQKYATSTFTYASCSICSALTAASNRAGVVINRPTSTTSPQERDISFGIEIPDGTPAGTLTGTNEFSAVAPGG